MLTYWGYALILPIKKRFDIENFTCRTLDIGNSPFFSDDTMAEVSRHYIVVQVVDSTALAVP